MKKFLQQLLMMAKWSFYGLVMQCFSLTLLFAYEGSAQNIKSVKDYELSVNFNNNNLEETFRIIESETVYQFVYDKSLIAGKKQFSKKYYKTTVARILLDISREYGLRFNQVNRNINVSKFDKKPGHEEIIQVYLQNTTITGTVKSHDDDLGLPGVNIFIKGTTQGTVTDANGNYSIDVPSPESILVFSSVGFIKEEIPVGDQSVINVSLTPDITALEEIVVVGYGSQISREITGSVQQIDAQQLEDLPVAQVTQKLQGRMAGVQINQATGKPGQGMKVRIRGQASILAGNEPLYVVDGFPIVGDISTINPDEIESISVLKDAASASLYGSRAANGVILITTKTGKSGQTNINLNTYGGFQQVPQKGRPDMMNGREFAQFQKESYEDRGAAVPEPFQDPEQYGEGYDWYDAMLRTAPIQNYTISLNTGKEDFKASGVLGYFNQDGVLRNSNFERYSLRLNSEFKVSNSIRVGFNAAPTYSINNTPSSDGAFYATLVDPIQPGGLLYNAMLTWPILPYKNEDGSLPLTAWIPGISAFPTPNWYRSLQEIKNETKTLRLLSNAFVEVSPLEGLSLKSTINVDLGNTGFTNFKPSTASTSFASLPPGPAQSFRFSENYISWLNENTATYTKQIGDHNFTVLGGFSIQKYDLNKEQIRATDFPDDRIETIQSAVNIDRGEARTFSQIEEWSLISYLARLNYNYRGKYLFTAAIRRDGSSRFGADNRWGNFPSVSAGWVVSDEPFLGDMNTISFLKLRASYGTVGNNNIGNYTQYAAVSTTTNAIFNGAIAPGASVTNIENTQLGWETTKQTDVGVDIGLFDDRIALAYDFYNKNTTNLLYNVAIPQESGFDEINANVGEFKFWGHEFTLNSKNLVGDFRWNTDFNIAFNRNKAVALSPGVDRLYGGFANYETLTVPGKPIGQFWGLIHDGVYVDQADFDSSPKATDSQVGTVKFKDVNGDGVITFGGDQDDRTFIGNPTPKFIYGLTNTFYYKNFDLSVVCSGSYGNDIMVMTEQGTANLDGVFNVIKDVKDRWRSPENPGSGLYGKTTGATAMERDWGNSRFVDDGSYFAIKNITLGYNFAMPQSNSLKSIRIYASIQQAAVFTKYRGVNPEVSTTTQGDSESVSALNLGYDFGTYPVPRTYTLGLSFGL